MRSLRKQRRELPERRMFSEACPVAVLSVVHTDILKRLISVWCLGTEMGAWERSGVLDHQVLTGGKVWRTDENKAEAAQMKESGQCTHRPLSGLHWRESHAWGPPMLLSLYSTDSYLGVQTFSCSCAFVEDNIGSLSVLPWQCWYPKPCLPT